MAAPIRMRRVVVMIVVLITAAIFVARSNDAWQPVQSTSVAPPVGVAMGDVTDALAKLPVKGRAPKTGYARTQFGDGWASVKGCDMRNIILNRDLIDVVTNEKCQVVSGVLNDPYGGNVIHFERGPDTSDAVQIDHVVALSDAWQKGAQQLTAEQRKQLANDPLELLAVDGKINQKKSDGDAATWLPPNKAFRCQYVARQVAVKQKYGLWVTQAEHDVIARVLSACPGQSLPANAV